MKKSGASTDGRTHALLAERLALDDRRQVPKKGIMKMRRRALALFSLACLSGCYTVNQERFSAYVASAVSEGAPLAAGVVRLEKDGFHCDPRSSAPATSCTRDRQSLLPYTCIERINLYPREDRTTIARVEVPAIVCAGL